MPTKGKPKPRFDKPSPNQCKLCKGTDRVVAVRPRVGIMRSFKLSRSVEWWCMPCRKWNNGAYGLLVNFPLGGVV